MAVASVKAAIGAVAAAMLFAPDANAGTAIYVDGTGNATPDAMLGYFVPPGYTIQRVNYPAQAAPLYGEATAGSSIAAALPVLDGMIRAAVDAQDGPVVVVGVSLGAMVVTEQLRDLANRPDAPSPSDISFVLLAAPTFPGGILSYLPYAYSDVVDWVMQPFPETPYHVDVIRELYDGISSFPDRPWHLMAVLNALAGGLGVYHNGDHLSEDLRLVLNGEFPAQDTTVTVNSLGGVTATYTHHASGLSIPHLLEAFNPGLAELVNTIITPLVNLGYSSHTPYAGPYLLPGGTLVGSDGQPLFGSTDVERPVSKPRARKASAGLQSAPAVPGVGATAKSVSSAASRGSDRLARDRTKSVRPNRGRAAAAAR